PRNHSFSFLLPLSIAFPSIPRRTLLYPFGKLITAAEQSILIMSFVDSPDNVRYEMNDQNRFYLCRHCRNHIVTKNNLIRYVTGTEPGYLCENVVNVGMDPVRTWRYLDDVAVLNVRCNDCHRHIGERFYTTAERRYLLHPDELLYWDGSRLHPAPTQNGTA
ncbi:hypothetical protein V6Z12_D03G155400, partial [Gossypium hirsutum]